MSRRKAITITVALLVGLAGCDGRLPSVRGLGTVVPNLSPPSDISARHIPSYDTKSLEEGAGELDSCSEWVTERDYFNRWSGEYEQIFRCLEGGDIETIHVLGTRDGVSSGHYRIIYSLRSGERIVWSYEYHPDPGSPEVVLYSGSSNRGETFEGSYRYLEDGATYAREVWTYAEGTYVSEGVYDADDRFNGTVTFDDPTTEESPDWHLVNLEEDDGSVTQMLSGYLMDGWYTEEILQIDAGGALTYSFDYDDLTTDATPDYTGGYRFDASGAGDGGYLQRYSDGSRLEVEQQVAASQSYHELWRFRDALTEQPVDQEGALTYDVAGNGVGTITTYVVGGSAETCDLTISAEGSTVISNCR